MQEIKTAPEDELEDVTPPELEEVGRIMPLEDELDEGRIPELDEEELLELEEDELDELDEEELAT